MGSEQVEPETKLEKKEVDSEVAELEAMLEKMEVVKPEKNESK